MREIKFRAWHLGDKRIVPWHEMRDDHYDLYELCNNGHTLMQYTGLKDKNGKEIYEFDIVKAWIDFGPGGEHLVTFPVTSSPFGVNIQEWNYKENRLPEVIGNIYEHSHLLK